VASSNRTTTPRETEPEVKAHVARYVEVKEQERRQKIQLAKAARRSSWLNRGTPRLGLKHATDRPLKPANKSSAKLEPWLDKLRTKVGSALTLKMASSTLRVPIYCEQGFVTDDVDH
jgi:hypothetical protein